LNSNDNNINFSFSKSANKKPGENIISKEINSKNQANPLENTQNRERIHSAKEVDSPTKRQNKKNLESNNNMRKTSENLNYNAGSHVIIIIFKFLMYYFFG